VFFSEEKNQKTFVPAPATRYGNWPDGGVLGQDEKGRFC
jgi:hypothetical protein